MASIIKRLWSGSDFWDKEENKQQRQQFIQDTKPTPGPSILSTVHNTINDTLNANTQADQQRRLSQGLPRYYQDQSNLSKITRAAETGGRVTARVLQGIGQDTLGAYDLLTPGHGTNRATKYYQNRGKETDQEVKDMGLDENVYKAGQVPLALGSYMIPGKAVSSAAKATQIAKVPQVVKLAGTLNKVPGVTKTIGALDDLAANGDRFQRITANLARSYTRPGNIADVGVDALQNAGHRTSLGQDNSAGTLALDAGMSLGMQGGMNLAGQGASAGIRAANAGIVQPTTRLVRNVANTVAPVQTTTKLIPRTGRLDLATSDALKAYNNMLVGADPNIQGKVQSDLIARIQQIGKENGVDLTNGSVEQRMARVEAMLNGYLPQTQTGRQFVGKPLGEGGYAKNPFYRGDDVAGGLSKEQSEFINDYANMLEGMGAGNGVDITPDGRRISNNVRDASTAGKTMSKQDWFDKARKDIESGKAGFGASDDYKKLPGAPKTDPLESLKQEARKYKSAEEFRKNLVYNDNIIIHQTGKSTADKIKAEGFKSGKETGLGEKRSEVYGMTAYDWNKHSKFSKDTYARDGSDVAEVAIDIKGLKIADRTKQKFTDEEYVKGTHKQIPDGYDGVKVGYGNGVNEVLLKPEVANARRFNIDDLYTQSQPPKSTPVQKVDPLESLKQEALLSYTGNDFSTINTHVKGRKLADMDKPIRDKVELLDKSMTDDIPSGTYYRGMVLSQSEIDDMIKTGKFKNDGYSSVSSEMQGAERFTQSRRPWVKNEKPVVFQLEVKNGQKGADLTKVSKESARDNEKLLPRNADYVIKNVTEVDGKYVVDAEYKATQSQPPKSTPQAPKPEAPDPTAAPKQEADYIKKIRQPIEKELKDAQAEMDKYGTGYINNIDRAAQQAKAKARLDRAREADWQNSGSKLRAKFAADDAAFEFSKEQLRRAAEGVEYRNKSEPWYKAREEIKANYIGKFKSADDFVADFNTNDGVIPRELKLTALNDRQYSSKEEIVRQLTDLYNQATQPPKSTLVQKQAPQPTKVATPFEKDLQAVGLAPSPQAKGSVGIPSRSTPKKPQRLEVPSDQTTELPRLRQSKANPANQPSNRNEVLSKETPVNAVDSTTNTKNTKPGLESRTPKKSLKTPQEKPVVSGTSRKLSTPEVKQPQNLQQPSTTASAGVGGQAVSKTQPGAYKQPKESQVSQNQVQSQESSSKTRGFIKSVLEDPNTNPKVKESISSLYTVRNTKELQTKAATLVKEHPDIAEQMSKSANDDASVAVAMELVKKHQNAGDYTRAIDLVESVAKDLTEAGRTVQAASIYGRLTPEGILRFTQKEINNYNKATGKDIKLTPKAADTLKTMADDLQKMPEGYDKDVAVAKMIAEVQKTMPATTAEKISTFQTMAQLLNPKTIIRNELGNSAFLGLENISQTVATPVDALMSLFTGKRTTTLPSVKTQVKGLIEGRKKGVSEAFQGINTGASTQYDLNSVPVFRGKVLGNLEKTMGAALRGGDRANYTAAFDDSLKGSMKLAKTKTATPEMLEAAHHAGLYRTFQDQNVISNFFVGMKKTLNTVGIGIKGKRFGLGDMVLKYPKTPANLLARGIDYSPAGFVKTVFEMSKPLFGKQFDQKVFVDSLSRATTGTAGLVGTGAMLGSLGIITEAPEKDKDLRDLQKQSGLGGYQINVSGLKRFVASGFSKDAAKLREGDKLVSYDWAQPAAIPVSMGAAIGKGKGAKEGAGKSVSALTEGIQTITEQPMVRGLQQFFGSNKGAGGIVGDLLKDTPASFIPTLSNQVRQLTDNTNRNTYDPSVLTESMNRVKNKIPGLASSVPARIGSLGETRENYQNGSNNPFNVFFNPSFVSNYDPKETAKLPLGINQRTGEVKQAPRSISTTQTVNGKSVKITAQQNQDLQKYVGTETDKAFSQLMKNPAFMALSDEEKANKMGTLITNINKAGKVLILGDEGYGTDSYKPTKLDRGVRDVLGGKYDYSTRSMKTGAASSDYAQQYADLKADFNDPNNGWSDVQKVAKTKELKRLEIKKDYDADTVALHSMSKADMYAYVSKAKNGKQLAEKLIAYDNALYEAGLSQYRKYKNGIAPASKGGGRKSGGRGGKRKAIPKDLMAKAMDVPKVAQLRQSKITAKQPQARSFKTRRKAIPKIAKSTPKLTVKRTQTA